MNREEIEQLLPHRAPMLLLDEVSLIEGAAVGSYTVRGDEFFLQGHFPNNPVVPGVILCEMMGQSACVLIEGAASNATPYFTGMSNVKFKSKVLPGDTVVLKSELIKARGAFYFIKAEAQVNNKLCAKAELSFAVIAAE
jgi:3-hydroxyacyl-[acyl-carrier-protein] dehydratase